MPKLYHFSIQNANRSAFWRNFIRRFGAISFGVLAQSRPLPNPSLRNIHQNPAREKNKRYAAKLPSLRTFLYWGLQDCLSERSEMFNVANTNAVSFQFVTQLSQLKIGIENWQHLHIGNNLPQNQAISKIPQ